MAPAAVVEEKVEPVEAPVKSPQPEASEPTKESESEEENLDDLEKHLREKALRSMRKAQASPPS
uniref:Uncharacterized protein n=1 Tax=Kangiella spongicola TaxID=796379 RepID=A0A318D3B4_9GAMM